MLVRDIKFECAQIKWMQNYCNRVLVSIVNLRGSLIIKSRRKWSLSPHVIMHSNRYFVLFVACPRQSLSLFSFLAKAYHPYEANIAFQFQKAGQRPTVHTGPKPTSYFIISLSSEKSRKKARSNGEQCMLSTPWHGFLFGVITFWN